MPSHSGPNTFGEDSLIFGYDLLDRANSYKNPPAINLVHANVARGSTSNWEGYGVHTGYGLVNNGNGIKDGRSDVVSVTWKGDATRTGDWYPRFNLRNPDGSYVTTEGGEVFYAAWEYKYEGEEYLVSGVPDFTTENFYGNGWKSGVHGSITTLYTQDLPLGWKRRVARIVAGDSGSTQTPVYRFGSGYKQASGGNFTLWLDNITITRDYPVHSWFPGQSEITPSEGLKDLIGNSTVDLSNVSFDDEGMIILDGTDDYIDLGPELTELDTSVLSIELVFRTASGTAGFVPLIGWHHSESAHGYICTGNFTGKWGNESISFYNEGSSTTPLSFAYTNGHGFYNDSVYHHVVFVLQTGNYRIFVDGEEKPVNSSFRNGSMNTVMPSNLFGYGSTPSVAIGVGSSQPSHAHIRVPLVKIYNKALSALEVENNFNALKGRFNIE